MNEKTRILLVDDEPVMRETLAKILREEPYEVDTAENAADAIKQLEEHFFNLAVVDIRLPGMNGLRVLERVKEINRHTIVIIVTAYATMETAVEALNVGADAYILKPLNIEEIKLVIKRTLENQKIVLENRELHRDLKDTHEKLKQSYLATLKTLARILELKDPYLKEHSMRVTKYAMKIARRLGFSERDLELMENTGVLHDLGKVGINACILQKKGSLTKEEETAIREHPVIGENLIDPAAFFEVEQLAIRHHHERFDGKGYPDGLAGAQIPIFARILAVADSFDAMTSLRPYRKALLKEKAIGELKNNSGTQFDPEVVNVFVKCLEEENEIKGAEHRNGK